jgi:hypothetical protein
MTVALRLRTAINRAVIILRYDPLHEEGQREEASRQAQIQQVRLVIRLVDFPIRPPNMHP